MPSFSVLGMHAFPVKRKRPAALTCRASLYRITATANDKRPSAALKMTVIGSPLSCWVGLAEKLSGPAWLAIDAETGAQIDAEISAQAIMSACYLPTCGPVAVAVGRVAASAMASARPLARQA